LADDVILDFGLGIALVYLGFSNPYIAIHCNDFPNCYGLNKHFSENN